MQGKRNQEHLEKGIAHLENGRYSEAVDSFRKQIKEDETSTKSLFHLKSTMKQINPTYSWMCENCSTTQTAPVFPSNDKIAQFRIAMTSALWGEIGDSARTEKCTKCEREVNVSLTLCEGCYENYVSVLMYSQKGSGMISHTTSMNMPKCDKCGYRPQHFSRQSPERQKRYQELLDLYPEVKKLITGLQSRGLLKL
ncbi:MAG: hypothetical protein ACFFFC_19600 [Candidatus Thorarchaeota archaeon]